MPINKLKRLFGATDARKSVQSDESEERSRRRAYQSGRLTLEKFAEAARVLSVDGERTINGSIHFVSLVKLRNHYGAHWEVSQENVHTVATRSIEANLRRNDIYARYHDDGYLILICNLWREAAAAKCRKIARDIGHQLFDEGGDDLVQVIDMSRDQPSLLNTTGTPQADASHDEAKPSELKTYVADSFDPAALIARAHTIDVEGPGLTIISSDDSLFPSPNSYDPKWEVDHTFDSPRVIADEYDEDVRLEFRPVWHLKTRVIASYFCVPSAINARGAALLELPGKPGKSGRRSPILRTAIDFLTLQRAKEELTSQLAAGNKFVLIVPIHYSTLNVPKNFRLFTDLCSDITGEQRSLIVFELIGVNSTLPQTSLIQMIGVLQLYSRAIFVRQKPEKYSIGRFQSLGVFAVGLDLSDTRMSDHRLLSTMSEFNERAQEARLFAYVSGLNTVSTTIAAIGAGFLLIAGEPVRSLETQPGGIVPFEIKDLYQFAATREHDGA
jgi:hypothetical protein